MVAAWNECAFTALIPHGGISSSSSLIRAVEMKAANITRVIKNAFTLAADAPIPIGTVAKIECQPVNRIVIVTIPMTPRQIS